MENSRNTEIRPININCVHDRRHFETNVIMIIPVKNYMTKSKVRIKVYKYISVYSCTNEIAI